MLLGKKYALRPLEVDDLPLLARWRNDPGTRRAFFTPQLVSIVGQQKWFQALIDDPTKVQFMICRVDDLVPVGTIGLHQIDHRNQDAVAGPIWLDPNAKGDEIALDAFAALSRYAFYDLNLQRLHGTYHANNRSAKRVLDKIGVQQEGVARKAAFVGGKFEDVVLWGLLRDEWKDPLADEET